MLPKFLIADNSQEAPDLVYVVHTEKPQCIIQCDMDGFYSNKKIYMTKKKTINCLLLRINYKLTNYKFTTSACNFQSQKLSRQSIT